MNLYGYAGGDPINFSDPFGLCKKKQQDADGNCPGGLSVTEWRQVESTYSCMTREASSRTRGLLNAGKIRGFSGTYNGTNYSTATGLVDRAAAPDVVRVNRAYQSPSNGVYSVFNHRAELTATLIHEGFHTVQNTRRSAEENTNVTQAQHDSDEAEAMTYENQNWRPLSCR